MPFYTILCHSLLFLTMPFYSILFHTIVTFREVAVKPIGQKIDVCCEYTRDS